MDLLFVVFSTQLYTASSNLLTGSHPFMEVMMDNRQLAQRLTSILLRHFSEYRPSPPGAALYQPESEEKAGVFRLVRTAAGKALPLN